MYAQFCCDIQLQKDKINQTRLTVGSDRLDYYTKSSTEMIGLKTIKIHFNSTILTKDKKYVAVDIKNFYTNSKLDSSDCMPHHYLRNIWRSTEQTNYQPRSKEKPC